jgi:hypothetical protein
MKCGFSLLNLNHCSTSGTLMNCYTVIVAMLFTTNNIINDDMQENGFSDKIKSVRYLYQTYECTRTYHLPYSFKRCYLKQKKPPFCSEITSTHSILEAKKNLQV